MLEDILLHIYRCGWGSIRYGSPKKKHTRSPSGYHTFYMDSFDMNHIDMVFCLSNATYRRTIIKGYIIIINVIGSMTLVSIGCVYLSLMLRKEILVHNKVGITRGRINNNLTLVKEVLNQVFKFHTLIRMMTLNAMIGTIFIICVPVRLRFGLIKWWCLWIHNHLMLLHIFEDYI